jgi:hypothetical protein
VIGGLEPHYDRESSAEFVIRAPCLEGIRTLLRGKGALPWDFFRPMCTGALFFPHRNAQDKSIAARLVAFYR